eukprot:1758680-Alexandrium_andersonii.AAC.1
MAGDAMKQEVAWADVESSIARAAERRPDMQTDGVCVPALFALRRALTPADRRLWLSVVAGGVWSPAKIAKFDPSCNGRC